MGSTPTPNGGPTPLLAYSATISSALFAATPDKPVLQPFQVILCKVPAGITQVAVTPQGHNVQPNTQIFAAANMVQDAGWSEIQLNPTPLDPSQPMTLTAPLVAILEAQLPAIQVN